MTDQRMFQLQKSNPSVSSLHKLPTLPFNEPRSSHKQKRNESKSNPSTQTRLKREEKLKQKRKLKLLMLGCCSLKLK